jgi:hypothetical protein
MWRHRMITPRPRERALTRREWLKASGQAGLGALALMVGGGALLRGQPAVAQQASPKIQEVYRYAVDHGETLQYIPCFCDCAKIDHHHNANCYIAERLPDGRITFTNHGAT